MALGQKGIPFCASPIPSPLRTETPPAGHEAISVNDEDRKELDDDLAKLLSKHVIRYVVKQINERHEAGLCIACGERPSTGLAGAAHGYNAHECVECCEKEEGEIWPN